MSVVFTDPDLQPTYQALIQGSAPYDWVLFNQPGNELKLQATGNGLEDLEEEFMDGRIQYAFARVRDPTSHLDKFVLISWCGDGVPEFKKGLYFTQSAQVQNKFLKDAHLVIQARSELDVAPSYIHKRIQESSGSKYSAPAAAPSIAMTSSVKPAPSYRPSQGLGGSQGKPTTVATPTPNFGAPPPQRAPAASVVVPSPLPAANEDRSINSGLKSSPVTAAPEPAKPPAPTTVTSEPAKPVAEDRIAPVGTAYTPIKLQPGKLANRWNPGGVQEERNEESTVRGPSIKDRMAAFSGGHAPSPVLPQPSGNKLSWAERQAEAKRQREEEEKENAAGKFFLSSLDTIELSSV
ncbi:hypothetical protein I309_04559 [Cryptococcus deuterogattii LA55]|nr:hypothetical protein I309_04559 [Cryptococcus deuterogattii LA55]KIR72379.1 hypothetical protein I310_03783 [Cryptococcus deuterogattii CA1014]KIR91972.1 hypothetical protein I304_04136 [Cryptococcus deuterogattii CBS 10090]